MGIYTSAVQKLYVAYFSRPADPLGLAFWEAQLAANGGNTAAISTAFSGSAEYAALYAGQDYAQQVNNLYVNLFGRTAEPAGLAFWVLRLQTGLESIASIALSLANNAQGTDATAVANKITAATAYTTAIDTTAEILGYSGYASNVIARAWLSTVTDTTASLTAATASQDATIVSATALGGTPGATFALTTGIDTVAGDTGNNAITAQYGTGATLTALDSIDGGAGTDTLSLSDLDGNTALPGGVTVKNVETVSFQSVGDYGSLDVSTWTGLTTMNVKANPTCCYCRT
jgi:hypothetical protein